MSFGFFLRIIILKFFQFLAWPPFTLLCPLYASIRAIESNTQSNYQQCLTYWVLYAVAKILESMLAKLLVWLPFWRYAKGITTFLLVVPYFHGASYLYLLLIKPYISGNSQIRGHLLIPRTKACMLNEQNDILDAADSYIREIEEEELEKSIIYEGESKSNHDSIESDLIWPSSPEKVQEWNTTSKKCMQKNFREEKHKGMEEERKRNEVAHETVSFPLTMEKEDGMTSLGNLNQTKWVNLDKLSSLFHPVARSFGLCTWEKPEFGWTKLNTDGSVGQDNASFGGLLRDYNGCRRRRRATVEEEDGGELWRRQMREDDFGFGRPLYPSSSFSLLHTCIHPSSTSAASSLGSWGHVSLGVCNGVVI